jgi:hypothetical protein
MCHVWGKKRKINTWFWWGNLKERVHLEDPSWDALKMNSKETGWDIDWINLASIKCREFIARLCCM